MKVLLVDDEPSFLEQAKIFLKKEDDRLEIETATSVDRGLSLLKEEDYDAIVSDYQMPGMDGLDFLEIVREERDSQIPFIIFTGKGREEVAMKALNLGADRYLQKGGDPKSQYGILADAIVQEHKHWRSKSRLKKSEREKSLILNSTPEIIAYHDTNHNLVWANKAYAEATGESIGEMEGRKCYEIWLGREEPCEGCPVDEALKTGKAEEGEMSPPGEEKEWLVRGSPILDEKGNIVGAIEVTSDITDRKETIEELKKSRERLRRSQSLANLGSWEIDLQTGELFWTDETYRIFGVPVGEPMDYDKFLELVHSDDRDLVDREWKKALEGDGEYDIEHRIVVDGETKWVREKADIKFDDEGKPVELIGSIQDVTEEREMERKIRSERDFVDTLLEASPVFFVAIDPDFNILMMNETMLDALGYDEEEVIGEDYLSNFVPEAEREDLAEVFEELIKLKEPTLNENHIVTKDEEKLLVEWHGRPIFDEDGELEYFFGVGIDITDRREMERREQLFESSLDQASTEVYWITPEGKFAYANDTVRERLGYSKDELDEMHVWDIDPKYSEKKWKDQWERLKDEKVINFESKHKTKDGKIYPVEITSHYLEHGGKKYEFAFAKDITERREMEKRLERVIEKYEELFHGSNDLVVTTDPEGYITRVNQKTLEHWGYSEEELVGESILKIAHPESVEKQIGIWKEILEKKEEVNDTVRDVTKDGEVRWLRVGGRPILEDGEIVEIQYNAQDITELVKTRRREEFLHSLLRHDVRNKAQVVEGYLDFFQELDLSEEYERYLKKAKQATKESISLIEKVRTLREIEEMKTEEVDLESLVQEAVESYKSTAPEMEFQIEMECPVEECKVEAGPLLSELFSNLLENSVQHSEGSKVRISSREKGEEIACVIEDDGKGIPDEEKEDIFERGYKRGENAGTGLGMYLVKEIAESYGGSIEVKDSDLGGARFEVLLEKA